MYIRKSAADDLAALTAIFNEARTTKASLGIDQWQDGYPSREVIEADVASGQSYCVQVDENVCGTFVLIDAPAIMDYAAAVARQKRKTALCIDTHHGIVVMRRMLGKNGFILCGVIYPTSGASRVAYEKLLT